MKKLFEVKVRGYYVLSMVAGVLLGLLIVAVANVMFMQVELNAVDELRIHSLAGTTLQYDYLKSAEYEHALQLMPLKGIFDAIINSHTTIVLALLSIITVVLYTLMISVAKHWRSKFLQSIGWMLLFLFVTETILVNISIFDLAEAYGIVVFLPAVLLVIPVLILYKTREMMKK